MGQALIENAKINAVASRDSHTGAEGSYQIRSLYFDDYQNSCYMSNENGVDEREKFRIRIYNHSTERITLECKEKYRGMTHKSSSPITLSQCEKLMPGRNPFRYHKGTEGIAPACLSDGSAADAASRDRGI